MSEALMAEIVAGIALLIGIAGWRRAGKAQKTVKRMTEEMDSLRSHVAASNNKLKQDIENVRNAVQKRATPGEERRFTADMMVSEALDLHPEAGAVLASFHLGGCSSCSISDHHVLGPAAESYGVDIDALLAALNNLLDGGAVPAKQPRGETLIQIDTNM